MSEHESTDKERLDVVLEALQAVFRAYALPGFMGDLYLFSPSWERARKVIHAEVELRRSEKGG